ncbi:alpha/beta fold hydrolase [Thiolapillus brandeum]|uniref:2-hydroxy-6-ketonona-24-dienedioic acid hydrolase n=1 Tax=Thiolapillus brandeum TaxID=1076588 RepID=A0A7U6JGT7_9GAMM|nr:alpha/beta hydrolase [Thiolapillus brandeum]BAO43854.1 2-hydroxy-6-ketonona-24-dienedioic acid hydrolase [Thiolapillus brandeum]
MTTENPEIGREIDAAGIATNYHDVGDGSPVLLIHGSGPGVSAWANWRLTIPALSQRCRVVAPDMVGFGFTERPEGIEYNMESWIRHAIGLLDALDIERASVVGNSFGGALALGLAIHHPERVEKLVLMGSVGVHFELTEGLDKVWGYTPSIGNMKELLDIFAHDRALVTDELAELRYRASIRPGFQESFSAMFPAPRQRWVDAMAFSDEQIQGIDKETLIIHGREDQVIPFENSLRLFSLIEHAELHGFGQCGHWTQIEHGNRFNGLVSGFLCPGD